MPRHAFANDRFLKIDLPAEEKERFRLACHNASQYHRERWSMARTMRALMKDFCTQWIENGGEDADDSETL